MTRRSSIYARSSKTPVRQYVADVEDMPARLERTDAAAQRSAKGAVTKQSKR